MTNQNPETGYRYTMYRADAIDPDMLDLLLYSRGHNLTLEAAEKEEEARQRQDWEDQCEALDVACQDAGQPQQVHADFKVDFSNFEPDIDEPIIEGTYDGVHYRTSWLGGALHLWVFASEHIGHFRLCSPCVSGACDGNSPTSRDAGYAGYAVPPDWLICEPDDGRAFADYLGEYE